MVSLTLCIPSHNRKNDVIRFLDEIQHLKQKDGFFNILVVDDASTDGTSEFVCEHHPETTIITLPENVGPARARNIAIAKCNTPYIAFFDSDAVPHADWFENAAKYLDQETIIAGKVIQPDGRVEWGPRRATFLGGSVASTPERANAASSCNMIVPVSLAKKFHGFNEHFFVYFEDPELCIRARVQAKARVRYADDLVVTHYHDSLYNPFREKLFWRNKMMGMLWLTRGIFKRTVLIAGNGVLLFTRLSRPRGFVASVSGFFTGIRLGLKGDPGKDGWVL